MFVDSHISERYQAYHKESHEKIFQRRDEFLKIGNHVESMIQKDFPECEIVYSPERLDSATSSYFHDIFRYKEFHGMLDTGKESRINYPKIFAFTSKWILKDKPFFIDLKSKNIEEIYNDSQQKRYFELCNSINEFILLVWMNDVHKGQTEKLFLDYKDFRSLIYNFRFRDFDTGILELLFEQKCDSTLVSGEF